MDLDALRHRQPRVMGLVPRLAAQPPTVLLLEGGSPQARQELGLVWAAALHCQKAASPCGHCPACQAALQAVSRDLVWVRGEEGEITVDEVRALRQRALDPPAAAPWRVVLVTEAQALNVPAQNALLKVLEEPAPATRFCLTVPHRDALLPTVVSRAFPLTLAQEPQPVDAEVLAWLESLAQFAATGGGDFLARTGAPVEAAVAQAVAVELQRAVLGALRGEPSGPLADILTRRGDVVSLRQVQTLAEEAQARLQLGVGPALTLEVLAMGVWRLLA